MVGFARRKAALIALEPPARFSATVADVVKVAGQAEHAQKVRAWAQATWQDWRAHHDYIRAFAQEA